MIARLVAAPDRMSAVAPPRRSRTGRPPLSSVASNGRVAQLSRRTDVPLDLAVQDGGSNAAFARLARVNRARDRTITVSHPDDPSEREAEAFAAHVAHRSPTSGTATARVASVAGRVPTVEPPSSEPFARARPDAGAGGAVDVSAGVEDLITRPGVGAALDPAVRTQVEPVLGADLGRVRVHRDAGSAAAAAELQARAFTVGADIFLAKDESPSDVELMAHESAHVVQQGAAPPGGAGDAPEVTAARVGAEDAGADLLASSVTATAGRSLQRQEVPDAGPGTSRVGDGPMSPAAPGGSVGVLAPEDPTLRSTDPEVDGRTVAVVGTDLQARTTRYRDSVDSFARTSEESRRQEVEWYRDLDLVGEFIDLFNSAPRTDPSRWDAMPAQWDAVRTELNTALQIPVTAIGINEAGLRSQEAIDHLNRVFHADQDARAEFSQYLQGFAHSAQGVHTVAVVVRDISFAAAVAVAVVIAAPVVFAGATTAAAGVGLTGTAATVATYGGTAVTMGVMGAGIEGGGQGLGALLVEGGGLLNDLLREGRTWSEAVDRFDWGVVGLNTWEGMRRGFVDGVLAYAGLGLDRVLAGGTAVALTRVLGQEGASTLAQIMRMALSRAISGGASGSVIGALDAGIKAALEGKSLGEVTAAMEQGFIIGGLAGVVLGGAGGAFEGRTRARLTAEISELQSLLVSNPDEFARRYRLLVDGLTPPQRAAWDAEMQGRRFVDRAHYEPAAEAFASGASTTPPAHRYGEGQFHDWQEAAAMLDAHAQSGVPLTQAEVEAAHAAAARRVTPEAGQVRQPGPGDLIGSGGLGPGGMFTALSPEQLAVLERNPHIRLELRGVLDRSLSPDELARRFETAVITYPQHADVQSSLDTFFRWYAGASRTMDATALAAAAQREFISIHPFVDGNGRVSRLVMDHALQRRGLPPSLLDNPNLDYMVAESAWVAEVRRGVVDSYHLTLRHVDLFNVVLQSGELSRAATVWGSVLGLTNDPATLVRWLYDDDPVCR